MCADQRAGGLQQGPVPWARSAPLRIHYQLPRGPFGMYYPGGALLIGTANGKCKYDRNDQWPKSIQGRGLLVGWSVPAMYLLGGLALVHRISRIGRRAVPPMCAIAPRCIRRMRRQRRRPSILVGANPSGGSAMMRVKCQGSCAGRLASLSVQVVVAPCRWQ